MEKHYLSREAEDRWLRLWGQLGIYNFDPNSVKPIYSVDTPPPYVSADHLHLGHAMSYIQAEIIIRYKRMMGYNIFYPMGFDDNGLPTERFVEKKYKINKAKISRQEFIDLCITETKNGAINYRRFWEALGIGVDWTLSYNTIGALSQKIAQKSFLDLYQRSLIYQHESPTFWCTTCQTALAQADLEDREEKAKMYYIRFTVNQGEIVIATTRPELLPACVALYVNPDDERYAALIGTVAISPLFQAEIPILADQDIDPNFGTGAMMVCTWGDGEDVRRWKSDQLGTKIMISPNGRLTEIAGEFQGLQIEAARSAIIERLKENGQLLKEEELAHTKNVHERCETPVEFLSSKQWFIKILDYKEKLLQLGEEIAWYPEMMKTRYIDWVANLKWDWCISRDRYYGVPFPLWHCADCGSIVLAEIDQLPIDPRESSSPKQHCPECGGVNLIGEKQVMDTWMTSSVTPLINAKWLENDSLMDKIYPLDLRIQAFEIIRTWLFYTVAKSWFHTASLPWKGVMISGWGLDKDGKKMSKSKGNIVRIDTTIEKYSADAIRWWATGSALGHNLRHSDLDLQAGKKLTNKLWNVARFIKPIMTDSAWQSTEDDPELIINFSDRWILAELQETIVDCSEALAMCSFNKARIALEKFFWLKYCDIYLELCKDRTWKPEKYDKAQIISLQYTLRITSETLLKLFAPFIPFATEEIYHILLEKPEIESIHTVKWPAPVTGYQDSKLTEAGTKFLEIINKIRHFKTTENRSLRSEISSLYLISDDPIIQAAIQDLAGLANAKNSLLNPTEPVSGVTYEIKGDKIILSE